MRSTVRKFCVATVAIVAMPASQAPMRKQVNRRKCMASAILPHGVRFTRYRVGQRHHRWALDQTLSARGSVRCLTWPSMCHMEYRDRDCDSRERKKEQSMLHYAVVFLVLALIAAVFGFGGVAV